ncbi:MAG TPA: hypothetical protein PLP29_15650 [Candidatus Ozemobacteraceae bacterium]|nr:hypothetical protein [Candidatus Ozemobacteraceae bacterium]
MAADFRASVRAAAETLRGAASDARVRIRLRAHAWCRGKSWFPRALVLLFLLNTGLNAVVAPKEWTIFGPVDLGIHETGHLLCTPFFPTFVSIAAGTIFQLGAPFAAGIWFLLVEDLFALAFCGAWFSVSLTNVAVYVADARARLLPLVSLGWHKTVIHDWNYMLRELGLLQSDKTIALFLTWTAWGILAISIAWGAWLCWLMATLPRDPIPDYPAT